MIGDTRALDNRMIPVIQASAKKIGITFTVRQINGAYTTIQTTSKNIPISERPGWGKDYADASTFFDALFASTSIIPDGNTNYSLVGITPQINQQKKLGVTGDLTNVPSIDPDIGLFAPETFRLWPVASNRWRASPSVTTCDESTATSLMIDVPIRIRSPSLRRTFLIFSPLTKVPFVEPRS